MAHGKLPEKEQFLWRGEQVQPFPGLWRFLQLSFGNAFSPRGVCFEGAWEDPREQEFVLFCWCGTLRVMKGDSPSAAVLRVGREWPPTCWNSAHLEQKIPTGMLSACGKQLFSPPLLNFSRFSTMQNIGSQAHLWISAC